MGKERGRKGSGLEKLGTIEGKRDSRLEEQRVTLDSIIEEKVQRRGNSLLNGERA